MHHDDPNYSFTTRSYRDINDYSEWELQQLARQQEAEARRDKARELTVRDPAHFNELKTLQQVFEESADEAALRIEVDHAIAARMMAVAEHADTSLEDAMALGRMAQTALQCHASGVAGLKPDGNLIVLHDHKCTCTTFCPWASREESKRLDEWYIDELMRLANEKPTHRVFYVVFTMNNFEPGRLAHGQQRMYRYIKHWLRDRFTPIEANPDYIRPEKRGKRLAKKHTRPFRKMKRAGAPFKAWPNMKGMLCVMESPLSRARDWNIHVNAMIVTDGRFDFDFIRQTFGYNCFIREQDKHDKDKLRKSLRELIKYSAMHVEMKQRIKPDDEHAPALIDYTAPELLEFYRAHKDFRRTRGFGLLHSIERKRWGHADRVQRQAWLRLAGAHEAYADHGWRDEPDYWAKRIDWPDIRNRIRRVMHDQIPLDLKQVQWIGFTHYRDGRYCLDIPGLAKGVNSIPEDNFSKTDRRQDNLRGFWRESGPPDRGKS
jgi:hypothetical protein